MFVDFMKDLRSARDHFPPVVLAIPTHASTTDGGAHPVPKRQGKEATLLHGPRALGEPRPGLRRQTGTTEREPARSLIDNIPVLRATLHA
jgi:hypothetical protein